MSYYSNYIKSLHYAVGAARPSAAGSRVGPSSLPPEGGQRAFFRAGGGGWAHAWVDRERGQLSQVTLVTRAHGQAFLSWRLPLGCGEPIRNDFETARVEPANLPELPLRRHRRVVAERSWEEPLAPMPPRRPPAPPPCAPRAAWRRPTAGAASRT